MPSAAIHADDADKQESLARRGSDDTALLDAIGSPLLVLDPTGWIVHANRACAELLGRPASEIVGRPFWDLLPRPEGVGRLCRWFADPAAQHFPLACVAHYGAQPGGARPLAWQIAAIANDHGPLTSFVATATDLTALHAAEAAATEGERRWGALFDNLFVGVGLVDCDRRLLDGNRALERIVGRTVAKLRGQPFPTATHPADRKRDLATFRAIATGQQECGDRTKRYVHRDGTIVWCHLTLSLLRDPTARRSGCWRCWWTSPSKSAPSGCSRSRRSA